MSAIFHNFWPLFPPPSAGIFLLLSIGKFGKFLTPSPPLKHADILNGWSLSLLFNWLLVLLMKNSNMLIVTWIYNLKVLASLSHQKSWFYGLKLRNYYYFMTIFLMTLPGIIWQNRIWDEARRNESRAEVPKREDVAQWTIISRPKLTNTVGSIWI